MPPCFDNTRLVWVFPKEGTSTYGLPIQMNLLATDKFRSHLNEKKKEEDRATTETARHSECNLCTCSATMASITSSVFQVLESITM